MTDQIRIRTHAPESLVLLYTNGASIRCRLSNQSDPHTHKNNQNNKQNKIMQRVCIT